MERPEKCGQGLIDGIEAITALLAEFAESHPFEEERREALVLIAEARAEPKRWPEQEPETIDDLRKRAAIEIRLEDLAHRLNMFALNWAIAAVRRQSKTSESGEA